LPTNIANSSATIGNRRPAQIKENKVSYLEDDPDIAPGPFSPGNRQEVTQGRST